MTKQPAPAGLGTSSAALWTAIAAKYVLRADELRILTDACHEMDLVDVMQAELDGSDLMIMGSASQLVMNPLLAEIRQHRNAIAALIRGLKLPDDGAGDTAGAISAQARAAANARWSRRGA